jgi:hypothetical protein
MMQAIDCNLAIQRPLSARGDSLNAGKGMVRKSPAILAIMAIAALTAIAFPAQAQSVRDFNLPSSSPTEEPEVQGPADDSGIVPVGPRVIPNEDSSQPIETLPVETGQSSKGEEPMPPESEPVDRQARPAPASAPPQTISSAQQIPVPGRQEAEPADAAESITDSRIDIAPPAPDLPPFVPADDVQMPETAKTEGVPQWMWFAIGGIFLFLAILGALFFRRRLEARQVPRIEPPIIAGQGDQTTATDKGIKLDIDVEVIGLSRSLMNLTLNCQVSIANRSARAVRDIGLFADLTSVDPNKPPDRQLADSKTALPKRADFERLGPHQTHGKQLSLQVPVSELEGFRRGEAALCIPLLRLRIDGAAFESLNRTFVIGLANGIVSAPMQPVPLHMPPGSFNGARARALD